MNQAAPSDCRPVNPGASAAEAADGHHSEYCIFRKYMRRHKSRYEWCWHFNMSRQDHKVLRAFFDLDYGSPEAALEAARAYRTAFMETFPPVTNLQRAQKIRKSNKSGIPGVYRFSSRGQSAWYASVMIDGRGYSRSFSINKYGEGEAKRRAIAARQELLTRFDPGFLRVPHEAQDIAEACFPEYLKTIPEPKCGKWMDDVEFNRKLAKIDARFAPRRTRARRLYINVNLLKSGRDLRIFVSNWQQLEKFLTSFFFRGDISMPLAKARAFVMKSVATMHGKEAARSFMDAHGHELQPEAFTATGQFRLRLIEGRDEATGEMVWRRVP